MKYLNTEFLCCVTAICGLFVSSTLSMWKETDQKQVQTVAQSVYEQSENDTTTLSAKLPMSENELDLHKTFPKGLLAPKDHENIPIKDHEPIPTNMFDLPPEIVEEIVGTTDFATLYSLSLTSKHFRSIFESLLQKIRHLNSLPSIDISDKSLQTVIRYLDNMDFYTLSKLAGKDDWKSFGILKEIYKKLAIAQKWNSQHLDFDAVLKKLSSLSDSDFHALVAAGDEEKLRTCLSSKNCLDSESVKDPKILFAFALQIAEHNHFVAGVKLLENYIQEKNLQVDENTGIPKLYFPLSLNVLLAHIYFGTAEELETLLNCADFSYIPMDDFTKACVHAIHADKEGHLGALQKYCRHMFLLEGLEYSIAAFEDFKYVDYLLAKQLNRDNVLQSAYHAAIEHFGHDLTLAFLCKYRDFNGVKDWDATPEQIFILLRESDASEGFNFSVLDIISDKSQKTFLETPYASRNVESRKGYSGEPLPKPKSADKDASFLKIFLEQFESVEEKEMNLSLFNDSLTINELARAINRHAVSFSLFLGQYFIDYNFNLPQVFEMVQAQVEDKDAFKFFLQRLMHENSPALQDPRLLPFIEDH